MQYTLWDQSVFSERKCLSLCAYVLYTVVLISLHTLAEIMFFWPFFKNMNDKRKTFFSLMVSGWVKPFIVKVFCGEPWVKKRFFSYHSYSLKNGPKIPISARVCKLMSTTVCLIQHISGQRSWTRTKKLKYRTIILVLYSVSCVSLPYVKNL